MKIAAFALAAAAVLAVPAVSAGPLDDDCRYTENRQAASSAAGVKRVIIHAEAGSLEVIGTPGAVEIAARGTACTSDSDFLSRITLTMKQSGSDLHIEARVPNKQVLFGLFSAKLDLRVTLPAGLPVSIDDGSGSIRVSDTGATTIEDGSGSIEVKNVRGSLTIRDESGSIEVDGVQGNVRIRDDSGSIRVTNVTGEVEIEDGSGSIEVTDIRGSVRIVEDGSGSISLRKITGSVTVDEDGSGGIEATDIGGDLRVLRKGSGNISHDRVAGRVELPRRR